MRGAAALGQAVLGLGVNTRVLMIGAHPDDEDTYLITWLSRGRRVETAYLSLTRGDGGQNLIGNELGEALGVIRTEELLAARRVDGAGQFFSRAFDFGFSKDTIDTYRHWPRDSVLGDVVRIVRAFRPHVIVAVFSGTPRDGHGHHQVSGLLARAAFDAAADSVAFPAATYGVPWTALKFYRGARFDSANATLRFNAGEYSPLLGQSYAELAGVSRSQHKSQAFGSLQRRGPVMDYLRREVSRVNEATMPRAERSLFDGIDTTWARFRPAVRDAGARAALDALPRAFAQARDAFDPVHPDALVAPLAAIQHQLDVVSAATDAVRAPAPLGDDLRASLRIAEQRVNEALRLAAGVEVDALSPREVLPLDAPSPVVVSLYNRGSDTVRVGGVVIAPGAVYVDTQTLRVREPTAPWWLRTPRVGAMFTQPASTVSATDIPVGPTIEVPATVSGARLSVTVPVEYRYADQVRGEVRHSVAGAPAVSVTMDQQVEYVRANSPVERTIRVHLRSADASPRDVRVTLALPPGLQADSAARTVRLAASGATASLAFQVHGRLAPGAYRVDVRAVSDGQAFGDGYDLIDYEHIRRQRLYRAASITLSAVDVVVPAELRVAYVAGVGDNVAPALAQLGIPVTMIAAADAGSADLSGYTTVVVGPRAYSAHPELVAANAHLLDFARAGGTLVVQYGQYEMAQPGILPWPVTYARPADRVTEEDAAVTVLDSTARELTFPNRIRARDFEGWVQERTLYMPHTFDSRYRAWLAMHDTGEAPQRGAILVTPIGAGMYVYTTMSFFRQLPAGNPGAARLFVNLLATAPSGRMTP